MEEKIYVFDPGKGRDVLAGTIIDDTFLKEVNRKKHYLRIVSGYAVQEEILPRLKSKGVKWIVIYEEDTTNKLVISLDKFEKNSKSWSHGHGKQITISERFCNGE